MNKNKRERDGELNRLAQNDIAICRETKNCKKNTFKKRNTYTTQK